MKRAPCLWNDQCGGEECCGCDYYEPFDLSLKKESEYCEELHGRYQEYLEIQSEYSHGGEEHQR